MGFLQIGSSRWFARYWKKANTIHAVSGITITIITLFEGISAFLREIGDYKGPHAYAGIVITCGVVLVSTLGIIASKVRNVKWNTPNIKRARFAHKIAGYFAFYTSFFSLSSGIFVYFKYFESGN
jgi:hypothetical protein